MLREGAPAGALAAQRDRVTAAGGLIVLAVAAFLSTGEIFKPQTLPGYDLGTYLGAAHRLLAGAPLYGHDPGPVVLGPYGQFFYPPPVAVAFAPLALLPVGLAVGLWLLFLGAIAVALGLSLTRTLVFAQRPWAMALFLSFQPLLWDIRLGNTALLTAALCWLGWRSRERPVQGGLWLAAALGVKLLPVLLLPYLLAAGRLRLLGWTALALLGTAALTLPLVGIAAWADYARLLGGVATAAPAIGPNVLPAELGSGAGRAVVLGAALALAVAGGILGRAPGRQTRSFALALAAAPLVSATVWYPYLTLALPALVLIGLSDPLNAGSRRLSIPAITGRLILWGIIGTQLVRAPERDFLLPSAGFLVVLGWAYLDLRSGTPAVDRIDPQSRRATTRRPPLG